MNIVEVSRPEQHQLGPTDELDTFRRPSAASPSSSPVRRASPVNCVIIDHGNAEYSVMMHMQPSSVTVRAVDRVVTGQVIGKLGNSGDSFGPHLHYQLQSGPRLFQDQPLPFSFQNIDGPLFRGRLFDAK